MSTPTLHHPDRLFIGGVWVEPHSGRQLEIVSPDTMTIAREEIFEPVLSLIPCDDSNYGLNGSVLTHNANDAWRIARRVRTGNVGQNGMRTDFSLPFGGYRQSGIGREGGAQGLMHYLETKTIMLDAAPGQPV